MFAAICAALDVVYATSEPLTALSRRKGVRAHLLQLQLWQTKQQSKPLMVLALLLCAVVRASSIAVSMSSCVSA